MSRWKAAGIHLSLSVVIAASLLVAMLALWYPPPYFQLMGGLGLVLLIAGCDVVLGPLCTLIVFKSGKPSLTFDLATIAFLQAVAMTYGLYTMFEARPVYTVFAVDRFEVTAANEIRADNLDKARPEFASMPLTGPRLVAAELPRDANQRLDLAIHAMTGGGDLKTRPDLYRPYEGFVPMVAAKARPIPALEQAHPESRAIIEKELGNSGSRDELGYVPIVGRFRSMTAIVNRKSGDIETVVDVSPW